MALLAVMLGASAVTGCGAARASTAVPPANVDSDSERVAAMVRQYYGPLLDTVTVGPQTEVEGCTGKNMFISEYRLRDIPLSFPFRIAINARTVSSGVSGGAEGDRSLTHESIGGVSRFAKLARQYHRDFPDQSSMSYWLASDNGVSSQEPYKTILRGHPGLSVIVYEYDDYWGDGESRQLGIYWWDRDSGQWELVHRGELPDLR